MDKSAHSDHRSTVRMARDRARRKLPCARCTCVHEPVIRRARYLSAAWRRDPAACFACADCGMPFEALSGPAAFRESDIAADRIPDPNGALTHFDLASELEQSGFSRVGPPELEGTIVLLRERIAQVAPSISSRIPKTGSDVSRGGVEFRVLGMPWMNLEVVVAEPGQTVDLASASEELQELASAGAEESFAICLASLDSWLLTDRELLPGIHETLRLAEAREFSRDGSLWQMRTYRVPCKSPSI